MNKDTPATRADFLVKEFGYEIAMAHARWARLHVQKEELKEYWRQTIYHINSIRKACLKIQEVT